MPRHRSKFTLVIDRTNASNENQDIEFLKAVSSIFQVQFILHYFKLFLINIILIIFIAKFS